MRRFFRAESGRFSFSQNSLLNLATQVGISGLAVVALPVIVHGLGDERFGLLSVCWLMLGYVGFLDLGIGQATVNLLASRVSAGRMEEGGRILRASVTVGFALSILLILLFEAAHEAGLLTFLNLSPALLDEARATLRIFALGIPPVLMMGVLRAVPYSMNRFDLVNLLQTAGAVLQWGGSIAVIALGGGLVGVMASFVATRYLIVALLYLYVRRVFPPGAPAVAPGGGAHFRDLLTFGGWVSVAQILGPLILLLERVIVSRTSSPDWITYFAVPQDTLLKLVVIPMSLASTLYPVVSARWRLPDGVAQSRRIYHDAVRYTYYVLLPVVFVAVVFGDDLLRLWLGDEFAAKSGTVVVIVACGVFFHALAQLPNTLILGSGNPGITARLLLAEILPYLALCYWLTSLWGIRGTAIAWLIRVAFETGYLFLRVRGLWGEPAGRAVRSYLWKGAALVACCGAPVLAFRSAGWGPAVSVALIAAFAVAYALALWFVVFRAEDRGRFLGVFRPAGS